MLLAVDVGNTNITFGVFDGDEMVTRFHFSVRISRTSDEYGSMIFWRERGFRQIPLIR